MTIILALLTAVFAFLTTFGLVENAEAFSNWDSEKSAYLFVALWFLFLFVVVTPCRMWIEQAKRIRDFTTPRLVVTEGVPYTDPNGVTYFRLAVTNPSGMPIHGVYGDLVSTTPLLDTPEGQAHVKQHKDLLREGLPPTGHKYPWSWAQGATTETIPPAPDGPRHLYVLAYHVGRDWFLTPTAGGLSYRCNLNFPIELNINIGSQDVAFPATKVRLVAQLGREIGVGPVLKLRAFEVLGEEAKN